MISCSCGKTSVTLSVKRVLFAVECCCCDCRLAAQWCADQGGPPVEHVPQRNVSVASSVQSVMGKENLKLFKLREGGESTRAVATCCFTTLLVSNWGYIGGVFLVPPAAKRTGFDGKDPSPSFRVFTKWWPTEWSPLPRTLLFPSFAGLPSVPWQLHLFFGIFLASRFAGHRGLLLKELGKVTILNLPKEPEASDQWKSVAGVVSIGSIVLVCAIVILAIYRK